MLLTKIKGQNLRLALMHLAKFCREAESVAGGVNVYYVISRLNEKYKLVPDSNVGMLAQDVERYYLAIRNQETVEINRGGYFKARLFAEPPSDKALYNDLVALTKPA